jgi:hypothetical protein
MMPLLEYIRHLGRIGWRSDHKKPSLFVLIFYGAIWHGH